MIGLLPCPKCGGEVEVIKLVKREDEIKKRAPQPYRIECRRCHALVARGTSFPDESFTDGLKRIQQYEALVSEKMGERGGQTILSAAGKRHNVLKAKQMMMSPEDTW
jgi:hypothetical protein